MISAGSRPWRLGLLGRPVSHSLSQVIHEAALAHMSIDGHYALHDVGPDELAGHIHAIREGRVHGLNVTVPHKLAVASLCDALSEDAARLMAVNTLCRDDDGKVRGHNTDISGLQRALSDAWPDTPWHGGSACVIGAGGAARAAVLALIRSGVSRLHLVNRTRERSVDLASLIAPSDEVEVVIFDDWTPAMADMRLIIHATPLGMQGHDSAEASSELQKRIRSCLENVAPDTKLYDLVYRPLRTVWTTLALQQGLEAENGLGMLLHQAVDAFQLWTGRRPPLAPIRKRLDAFLV